MKSLRMDKSEFCYKQQVGEANPPTGCKVTRDSNKKLLEVMMPAFKKSFQRKKVKTPVPRTNTRGQEENSKVSKRTIVKELGKMTP